MKKRAAPDLSRFVVARPTAFFVTGGRPEGRYNNISTGDRILAEWAQALSCEGVMRLFWMAWGFALTLLATAIGGSAWFITISSQFAPWAPPLASIVSALVIVFAFVAAFRLAILGTMALKRVLARNLAIVIAMQLAELRASVAAMASVLDQELPASAAWPVAPALNLEIPEFFGKRQEIQKLLGRATEHTLEELLTSLNNYNASVEELTNYADAEVALQIASHLRVKIGQIADHIRQATGALAPFNRSSVSYSRR